MEWFQAALDKVSSFLDEVPNASHSEKKWDAAAKTISSMDYNPTQSTALGGTGSGLVGSSEEQGKTRGQMAEDAFQQFQDAGYLNPEEPEAPNFKVGRGGMENIAPKLGAAPDTANNNPYLSSASKLVGTDVRLMGGKQ